MSPNLRIAFRFLTAKKRAMLMSLSCTILGVGLFIVTQATTSGFEEFFVRTLLGTDGAMRIEDRKQVTLRSMEVAGDSNSRIRQVDGVKLIEGVEEPQMVIEAARKFANVRGASAVIRANVQVTSPFKTDDAQVFGIKLADHRFVSALERKITTPDGLAHFQESASGALVGRVLAGMEALSALPRGSEALGFYKAGAPRPAIRSARLAADLPAAERPGFEVMRSDAPSFAQWLAARASRTEDFFLRPAGALDICNALPPVRAVSQ